MAIERVPVRPHITKNNVITHPILTGGRQPCLGRYWRLPATTEAPGIIMPLLEAYLIDVAVLPSEFATRVSDCADEAMTNAGQHSRTGTEIQVTCRVEGEGPGRRCSIKVFNYGHEQTKPFPDSKSIPSPDIAQEWQATRGRGLAIMNAQADAMDLEDLPGFAKEVTLSFNLTSSTH